MNQKKVAISEAWVKMMEPLYKINPDGWEQVVLMALGLAFGYPDYEECIFPDPVLQGYWEKTKIKTAKEKTSGSITLK